MRVYRGERVSDSREEPIHEGDFVAYNRSGDVCLGVVVGFKEGPEKLHLVGEWPESRKGQKYRHVEVRVQNQDDESISKIQNFNSIVVISS